MSQRIFVGAPRSTFSRRMRGGIAKACRGGRLAGAVRPVIESLETRRLLSANVVYINQQWAGSSNGSDPGNLGAGNSFGYDEFATIQSGIAAVASGGTVIIDPGNYTASNIVVSQPMTIEGTGESNVVISPASSDSHDDSAFGGSVSNGFVVEASGVTIEDLTLDGGANQDYRAGVITNSANDGNTYNDTIVANVTMNNIFRQGVALYNFTGESTGNVVENNTFNNVGSVIDDNGNAYQVTAAIGMFQSDGTVEGNSITNSAAGIVGTTFDGSSQTLSVTSNSFTSAATVLTGALGIDLQYLAAGSTVSGNTIDLTGTGTAGNDDAIVVGMDQGAVSVDDNTILGQDNDNGIVLFNDGSNVTLDGNSIQTDDYNFDNGTGILLTDQSSDTSQFGAAPGAVYATLTNDTVVLYNYGVWLNSSGDPVVATIGDPNNSANSDSIFGDETGVEIDGSGSLATITNNAAISQTDIFADIAGCVLGVGINGGTADIDNNFFQENQSTIQVISGTANIDGNTFLSNVQCIEVDAGSMTADNNLFFGNYGDLIYVPDSGSIPSVTAYDNGFYAQPGYLAVDDQNPDVIVIASDNYWGSDHMTDADVQDVNYGEVDFSPWLDTGTAPQNFTIINPTGFTGNFSAIDVGPQSTQVGSAIALQLAIDTLSPGGVITLTGGTYDTNLDITEPLTIDSADGAASTIIADPPGSGGAITIASGVDGVTISGLTIEATTSPWALDVLGSDATITDNVFESSGTGNVQVADDTDTITGNTFISPAPSDESGFEQFNDTTAGDDSSGEITGILANNTFDRAYTLQDSSGNYVRTIWADLPSVLAQVSGASSSTQGATYTLNLNPALADSPSVTGWTINWGDGSSNQPDIQTITGDPTSVTHVYANGNDNGSDVYTISASVQSGAGSATANSIAVTVDDAPLTATGSNINASEGISTGMVTVATLTDAAGAYSSPTDLSATINWGDNSSSAATLVQTNSPGVYDIEGAHTYGEFGNYTIKVSVQDVGGSTASAQSTATVSDAALTANGVNINATQGTALSNVTVATLTDTAGSQTNLSDLSATINWGDSSSSAATFVATSTPGVFDIQGSHTYGEFGSYTIKVNVQDAGGSSASAQSTATVGDATLSATGVNITPTEGTPLSNVIVATLTDAAGTYAHITDLSATINWGDGSSASAATLVATATPGVYDVEGSHTYAQFGTYTINVSASDVGGSTATAHSTATVADASLSAASVSISATEGTPLNNVTVATLTDGAGSYTNLANLSATINWGDSTVSQGTLLATSTPGVYSIQGSHTYAEYGAYTVAVSITDVGGNTASAQSTAHVADASLSATGDNITATQGQAISNVTVAVLTDGAGSYTNLSNLSATINWGDSTTSAGTFVATSTPGVYNIQGSHTFSSSGNFTTTVTVNDTGGNSATAHATASVASAVTNATVAHEYLFYYGSTGFDGGDSSPSSADYKAIATNKTALLPGHTATFANVSSYTDGINGILVDFANLPATAHLTAADFQFKVGNSNSVSTWATAPAPAKIITFVGPNGDTFADITWANGAIKNEWLQVTVLADSDTHLASKSVFYFGNLEGATGISQLGSTLYVTPLDVLATALNLTNSASITDLYDFNRNGTVNLVDLAIVVLDESPFGLDLITVPS